MKQTLAQGVMVAAIALIVSQSAFGIDPRKLPTQYIHRMWFGENGLPQSHVSDIAQTSDGYLWFATEDGLARFDGSRFVVFSSANIREISNNHINSLYDDGDGLWIGMENHGL